MGQPHERGGHKKKRNGSADEPCGQEKENQRQDGSGQMPAPERVVNGSCGACVETIAAAVAVRGHFVFFHAFGADRVDGANLHALLAERTGIGIDRDFEGVDTADQRLPGAKGAKERAKGAFFYEKRNQDNKKDTQDGEA